MGSKIKSIHAREIISARGHPGVETTVTTEDGSSGTAVVASGTSVGDYEVSFLYDGGRRWNGMGVQKAAANVNSVIAGLLSGMDVTNQAAVDESMIALDGTPNKSKLGGNAIASVSAAVLKAGANCLGVQLFQYMAGVNANVLPVPGVIAITGSDRYGQGRNSGEKPTYSFIAYDFSNFSEATYACWEIKKEFLSVVEKRFGLRMPMSTNALLQIPPGKVRHDSEIWEVMTEAIDGAGFKNRVGIQVDVAAGTYYDRGSDRFVGLFSEGGKTKEDLMELYKSAVANYPFLVIEDPLDMNDFEGHSVLTRELGIQIVGDDIFATNMERLRQGISLKACNAILLKVNQVGTVSEALDVVRLAYRNGYAVMPCSSRGEGADIADYAVGLNTGQIREGGLDDTANRLLAIESELGRRASFLKKSAFKP